MAKSNIEMQRERNRDGVLNRYVYFMIPGSKDQKADASSLARGFLIS